MPDETNIQPTIQKGVTFRQLGEAKPQTPIKSLNQYYKLHNISSMHELKRNSELLYQNSYLYKYRDRRVDIFDDDNSSDDAISELKDNWTNEQDEKSIVLNTPVPAVEYTPVKKNNKKISIKWIRALRNMFATILCSR